MNEWVDAIASEWATIPVPWEEATARGPSRAMMRESFSGISSIACSKSIGANVPSGWRFIVCSSRSGLVWMAGAARPFTQW